MRKKVTVTSKRKGLRTAAALAALLIALSALPTAGASATDVLKAQSGAKGVSYLSAADGDADDDYTEAYRESLSIVLQIALEQDVSNVKPANVQAFHDAVAAGQAVLANASATWQELNAALVALSAAMLNLPEIVDRSGLEQLIASAGQYAGARYTAASWAVFQAALNSAKTAAADLNNDAEDISAAWDALVGAIAQLVKQADKAVLAAAIAAARDVAGRIGSVPSAVKELNDAIAQAAAVNGRDDATQQEVDQAAAALTKAAADAQLKAARSGLASLIRQAGALNRGQYTAQSAARLASALAAAQAAMAGGDISQATVDSLAAQLRQAISGLVKKPSSGAAPKSPDTGADGPSAAPLALAAVLGLAAAYACKKHGKPSAA